MSKVPTTKKATQISEKRIIGSVKGDPKGPIVVMLAGMHGNEPVGVEAAKNILDKLEGVSPAIDGHVLGIRANISALEQQVRYIDEDMNRLWFSSILEKIRSTPEDEIESSERREIKRLLSILDTIDKKSGQPTVMVDLHTFSAEGYMFAITNNDLRQRQLLSHLKVPMVFGIGESLRGTALRYYQEQGFISFGLEGGQHQNKLTENNITCALMLLLQAVGCIEQQYVSDIQDYREYLQSQTKHLPVQTKLVYQHIIEQGDAFKMRPGYQNFQPVTKGEWLASDQNGKIKCRCDGYILMPLYQRQGNDGFLLLQEHEG
ncbi:MAG: succinylglutamate desuccinylase/aspartoacylase family protein [Fodinibius sp.]|nr:succinylglutamate desuccinylase/aspartoacylase family protein [Fodinibius sp.]